MSRASQTSCHRTGINVTWLLEPLISCLREDRKGPACPLPPSLSSAAPCARLPTRTSLSFGTRQGTWWGARCGTEEGTAASAWAVLPGSGPSEPASRLRCHHEFPYADDCDPLLVHANETMRSFTFWSQMPLFLTLLRIVQVIE